MKNPLWNKKFLLKRIIDIHNMEYLKKTVKSIDIARHYNISTDTLNKIINTNK